MFKYLGVDLAKNKPSVAVTPIIRRALEDVIESIDRSKGIKKLNDDDKQYARRMLDSLAEFAAQNAVDPKDERNDSITKSGAYLDRCWAQIEAEYFDRLYAIGAGDSQITDKDQEMIRFIMGTVGIQIMWEKRKRLVERMVRPIDE